MNAAEKEKCFESWRKIIKEKALIGETESQAFDRLFTIETSPVACAPCNAGLSDLALRVKLMHAFIKGYEEGTEDAIDGASKEAEARANDWMDEQSEI